jgi:hypothetical protein
MKRLIVNLDFEERRGVFITATYRYLDHLNIMDLYTSMPSPSWAISRHLGFFEFRIWSHSRASRLRSLPRSSPGMWVCRRTPAYQFLLICEAGSTLGSSPPGDRRVHCLIWNSERKPTNNMWDGTTFCRISSDIDHGWSSPVASIGVPICRSFQPGSGDMSKNLEEDVFTARRGN